MSHWEQLKTKVKSLETLKRAAVSVGLEVVDSKTYRSRHAGQVNCVAVLKPKGRMLTDENGAAIVGNPNDGYAIQMDNYHNPIVNIAGNNCSVVGNKYAQDVAREEVTNMGYMEDKQFVDPKTRETVIEFMEV